MRQLTLLAALAALALALTACDSGPAVSPPAAEGTAADGSAVPAATTPADGAASASESEAPTGGAPAPPVPGDPDPAQAVKSFLAAYSRDLGSLGDPRLVCGPYAKLVSESAGQKGFGALFDPANYAGQTYEFAVDSASAGAPERVSADPANPFIPAGTKVAVSLTGTLNFRYSEEAARSAAERSARAAAEAMAKSDRPADLAAPSEAEIAAIAADYIEMTTAQQAPMLAASGRSFPFAAAVDAIDEGAGYHFCASLSPLASGLAAELKGNYAFPWGDLKMSGEIPLGTVLTRLPGFIDLPAAEEPPARIPAFLVPGDGGDLHAGELGRGVGASWSSPSSYRKIVAAYKALLDEFSGGSSVGPRQAQFSVQDANHAIVVLVSDRGGPTRRIEISVRPAE